MKCPTCGRDWSDDWRDWQRHDWRSYDAGGVAQTLPAGATYEKRQPERGATVEGDVIVPIVQSLASGVVASIVGGVLSGVLGWRLLPTAGISGVGALALSWVVLLREHRGLLWRVERVTGADLDGDHHVGKPETVRVEVTESNGQRLSFLDLPATPRQLRKLARGLTNGKGTGESAWTGSGNSFSRSDYRAIRDALIDRSLARWVNPDAHAQGWELTGSGRSMMRKLADRPALER